MRIAVYYTSFIHDKYGEDFIKVYVLDTDDYDKALEMAEDEFYDEFDAEIDAGDIRFDSAILDGSK